MDETAPLKIPQFLDRQTVSIKQAAAALDVGTSTVARAKKVIASGDQDLIDAVTNGDMPVTEAAEKINPPAPKPTQNINDIDCQRIIKVWDKASAAGRALFLEAIGATTRPPIKTKTRQD